jgi:hypothetical protein
MRGKTKCTFDEICAKENAIYLNGIGNPVKMLKDHFVMYVLYKDTIIKCLIDKQDLGLVKIGHTWVGCINGSKDKIYIGCNHKGRRTLLHRLLTDCPNDKVVDHINGNTYDNRQSNIRVCTPGVNMLNKKKYNNNKTGTTGIIKCKGNYRLSIIRQFNDINIAKKAKQEIQHIIDHYSLLDAANR